MLILHSDHRQAHIRSKTTMSSPVETAIYDEWGGVLDEQVISFGIFSFQLSVFFVTDYLTIYLNCDLSCLNLVVR
jgi:hypothetical protein